MKNDARIALDKMTTRLKKVAPLSIWMFALFILCSCSRLADTRQGVEEERLITREVFGTLPDGRKADLFTIKNPHGFEVKLTNYGGIITSIIVSDKKGKQGDVVLGFDDLAAYAAPHPHMGPVIGRYSGYIANGAFVIDGVEHRVAKNSGANHLHGGVKAFDKVLWDATEVENTDGRGVRLKYRSSDGEEGYPGNLDVALTYLVRDDNSLQIDYEATSDKRTHVNLTNHLYFNLSGGQVPDISTHELSISATHYAVPGAGNIPTGELRSVDGTALDFRKFTVIGAHIDEMADGYDHNYVLKTANDDKLVHAASVFEPVSGRVMDLFTTHTGLEFASADWLNVRGKAGRTYGPRSGFLLYPQHLPDSPNRPQFPSTLLEPGDVYHQRTVYSFSTR